MIKLKPLGSPFGTGFYIDFGHEENDSKKNEMISSDDEINRIKKIINSSREKGLQEISLEISSELASSSKSQLGSTLEQLPFSISFDVEKKKGGKYTLNIKMRENTNADDIQEYYRLFKKGVITESEFKDIKSKIISNIGISNNNK